MALIAALQAAWRQTAAQMPAAADRDERAAQAVIRAALRSRLEPWRRPPAGALFADETLTPHEPADVPAARAATLSQLADAWPALLGAAQRKQQGTWFTDEGLVQPTVARTLVPLLRERDPATLRIVDPAVGGGRFLAAAARQLRATGLDPIAAARCVHGRDLDPTAAALAAWSIWEALGDRDLPIATLEANVQAGDGLAPWSGPGFHAVLGNPPWETLQWQRAAGDLAVGDRAPERLQASLQRLRAAFKHQGSGKLFTYRLFVEQAVRLLHPGGRLGLVVPASLWFDQQAAPLRRLLLDDCAWEWLFGFENRRKLFPIDNRYRFGVIVATKGGRTSDIRTAFGRLDVDEWQQELPPHQVMRRDDILALSPAHATFVETDRAEDFELLCRLTQRGQPLLGSGGLCTWRQGDCNMTTDLPCFQRRTDAEAAGWQRGGDGTWQHDRHRHRLLPLWQGTMIGELQPNAAAHALGAGRSATWVPPQPADQVTPQFLIAAHDVDLADDPARLVLRALSNATNERTAIAALLPNVPCGNSLGVLRPRPDAGPPLLVRAFVAGVLSSLLFDWTLRQRLGGTNLNAFVLTDTRLPIVDESTRIDVARLALRLSALLPVQDAAWQQARDEGWLPGDWHRISHALVEPVARRDAKVALDILVARAWGALPVDLRRLTADCALPCQVLADRRRTQRLEPKGFWRVDRQLPPAERRTIRAAAEFSAAFR
ncbi:MAG: N-6 DNA methylase [Planctomycetes bacterium]|nr:N-6 DNA methylase [Planctomycetota bacterium]